MSKKDQEKREQEEKGTDTSVPDREGSKKEQPSGEPHDASPQTVEAEPPIDSADDLKQQLEAQSDRYLRLMAEFDNFKKRVSRDYERLVESANEKLIGELLEVRENFERAVKTGEQTDEGNSFFQGMKLIFTKFDDVLAKNGLEPFGKAGDPFDPQLHDALMKSPHHEIPEDHIADVFEKGYSLKKRIIRHAKVVVSSGVQKMEKEITG